MARSARELFEEAMRLDPAERATLMRLLIDTLDAESEEGAEDAWRAEVERRIAELDSGARSKRFPGKSLERGCTSAEWPPRLSGSILLQRRRRNPRMTDMPQETPQPRRAFVKSYDRPSTLLLRTLAPGRVTAAALNGPCSRDTP